VLPSVMLGALPVRRFAFRKEVARECQLSLLGNRASRAGSPNSRGTPGKPQVGHSGIMPTKVAVRPRLPLPVRVGIAQEGWVQGTRSGPHHRSPRFWGREVAKASASDCSPD
jgi:hypothetical protein